MEEEKFHPFHSIPFTFPFSLPFTAFGRGHQNLFQATGLLLAFPIYLQFVTKRGVGGGKVTAMDLLGLLRAETLAAGAQFTISLIFDALAHFWVFYLRFWPRRA